MELSLKDAVTVSWYDGVIEAFVRRDDGDWAYASMIAWDPSRKLRIFGLVAADIATVSEVRALSIAADGGGPMAESWQRIRARVAKFLRNVQGAAELRLCDQLDGDTKDCRRIDATSIIDALGCEIEEACDSARFALWLAKFSTSD